MCTKVAEVVRPLPVVASQNNATFEKTRWEDRSTQILQETILENMRNVGATVQDNTSSS